ncbi:hypothetical protein [Sphingomonas sp. KR3-1]|uniref:hypothetical protein n=1 Tax=Sphingomonas sp. KR3-1 TaxID=3156611 RepID=UPI0032B4C944
MSEEATPAADNPGCLALFLSVALPALLLTITVFPPAFATPMIYIPIFVVTGFIATVIGLPLYLVAAYFQRKNVWTALAAGVLTGALLPVVGALSEPTPEAWRVAAGYAATGAVGGLTFYLIATVSRAPRRNLALLLALAGFSVAAALRI